MAAVRDATEADLEAINAIYNYYVPRSTCTFELEPATMDERRAWFAGHGAQHPVIVATDDGDDVVGWGCLGPFRARAAYAKSVEHSVYVRHDQQRCGIGRALVDDLVRRARALGHHVVIGGVSGDQEASVALHRELGFREVGHFREVGFKFGRWLDVVFFERLLDN